jgi:hypothetical protein
MATAIAMAMAIQIAATMVKMKVKKAAAKAKAVMSTAKEDKNGVRVTKVIPLRKTMDNNLEMSGKTVSSLTS